MPKRSTTPRIPSAAEALSDSERPVRLTLPPDDHDRLRVMAASARLPMSQFVRQLVLEKISEKKS